MTDRQVWLDAQLSDADRALGQLQQARRRVLRELQSKVDVLEGRLPSSRLSSEP
jgi:hypothetical protein